MGGSRLQNNLRRHWHIIEFRVKTTPEWLWVLGIIQFTSIPTGGMPRDYHLTLENKDTEEGHRKGDTGERATHVGKTCASQNILVLTICSGLNLS